MAKASLKGSFRGGSRGGFRGRGRGGSKGAGGSSDAVPVREDDGTLLAEKFERVALNDEVDEKLGFARVQEGPRKEGWLINMHPTTVKDPDWPSGRAAAGTETTVEEWLKKRYEGLICGISREKKEDLKMPNHLMGHRRLFLQIRFRNITDLLSVGKEIAPLALANSAKRGAVDAYAEVVRATGNMDIEMENEESWMAGSKSGQHRDTDPRECIIDIREYDVPYYLRAAIDNEIRVGLCYAITFTAGQPLFSQIVERVKRADPVVMAYDIETTNAPLKFPDQAIDQVMMISYMVDGQGYLITNREIVREDIDDFEYTPKEGYEGPFIVYNEPNEAATIKRWFSHIQEVKPTIISTFNGDFFDMPFLDARSKVNGLDMFVETGFAIDNEEEYKSRTCVHMDCFRWVKRDSYLPQGSQGLKAVTTAKLGYNPIELDPELMTPYAVEQPQILAQYSVSDAVATYYLYMKYVHPFIFSLCNIIPLNPDEVLRKGSGTLCETLLMVEAYRGHIIMPNRHEETHGSMYDGHLLSSETYVGGHLEALEAGVFRSNIPTDFKIVPAAVQGLIDDLDAALTFCITEESKASLDDVTNYDEVKEQIQEMLELMRDNPKRVDSPLIYHLDVAAMYPNIMLSNRLQPDSMVEESVCAVCDFNRPGKTRDRRLEWARRGEYFPAHRDEFNLIKHALNQETFPGRKSWDAPRRFTDLSPAEQTALLHKRLGGYPRKVYKKTKETKVETRESIVCQRENPYYVDTVRRFRDRRYDYKGLHKTWKKNLDNYLSEARSIAEVDEAKKMIVLYDSLQLAHKCILYSFYGYVMRKGARWHSMEMAGITCLTGATIMQMARALVEQIGRPLELDTDGIWCMLPGVFPENFKFKLKNGKAIGFSYPCTMLNHLVHAKFTNDQVKIHSENSIFFELDGPYKAMILPSSKEEDKLLKKRYAVFNDDGSLEELKGFEVKRRGELQLIKIFQSQIFEKFLLGITLQECYTAVAQVADQWLGILYSRAETLSDEELVDLIAENRSMFKTLAEYGGQKSTSISTAKRLAEFLGDQMVKDKGLACKFIISAKPVEESVKRTYLRKWLKDNSLTNFDLRFILDWDYYLERLGSPDCLFRRVANPMTDFFRPKDQLEEETQAMEDIGTSQVDGDPNRRPIVPKTLKPMAPAPTEDDDEFESEPMPNPTQNYSAWIRHMRPKWKKKLQRKWADQESTVVPSIFQNTRTKVSSRWDILLIRQSKTPGRFLLWVYVDTKLYSNLSGFRESSTCTSKSLRCRCSTQSFIPRRRSREILPHDLPCTNLYHISVREEVYQDIQEHFIDLVNDPNVDGVFELQVPLVIRGLLKLGKSCSLSAGNLSLNRAQQTGLDLQQLDTSPSTTQQYLTDGKMAKHIFLYHATTSNGAVQIFAVFYPNALSIPAMDTSYRDILASQRKAYGESQSFTYPSSLTFDTAYHSNDATALKAVSRELGLLSDNSLMVTISSNKDISYFDRLVPKLSKFPNSAGIKVLKRYVSLDPWLDRMIALANYYDIPIGHIEGDTPLLLSDISFARKLMQQDMVLWWSPSDLPDLGGVEADIQMLEEFPRTDFLSPCVVVNELEGSGGTASFDSVSHTLDECKGGRPQRDITLGGSRVSTQMFGILKNMIKGWLLDKIQHEYMSPAGLAIDHFWRWITSKGSQLYDPSLHWFIHGLMRETFIQLLAEFKRLGSHVVYADFSTILLATSKPPEKFYDFLVCMDRANVGGVVCEDPLAILAPTELSIEMNWNIQTFLPLAIRDDFEGVIQTFIVELFKIRRKINASSRALIRPAQTNEPTTTQPVEKEQDPKNPSEKALTIELIARKLTRKLLKVISDVQERQLDDSMNPESDGSFDFPTLPGSHLHMTNPTLELVKFFQVEMGLLKRNLLELVGVKEFAPEATYRNPCEPLTLANVPCRHCDVLRDFDFCRDSNLLHTSTEVNPRWLCTSCGGEYDKTVIEFSLIDMARAIEQKFARQDLRCGRCQQIQGDNVSRWCQCSGTYNSTLNKGEARKTLKTMVNVAREYKLGRLKEYAQTLLTNWA
ncbi:DNA polymerase epsilon catalytic subunit A [Coprinopsis sp. MPI-PUGE-AT-0042]|nr:DNA polymerase epsilon catalytic subunit A [Coprinopsis sp. MPI-PUGE-AT-0042]